MFGLFSRNKVSNDDLIFLTAIVSLLPEKYSYLTQQVNRNFLLSKEANPLGDPGTYVFAVDEENGKKFINHKLPSFFIIKGIKVFNIRKNIYEDIELHIHYGTLIGFKVDARYKYLDINKTDISNMKEQMFSNDEQDQLDKILASYSDSDLSFLDLFETFKIELENNEYYVIKDLKDGNYLSVNTRGAVFCMINDPCEIELLFNNFDDFLKAINEGTFDIQNYIDQKLN